jgi:signal transduction histidine kinase
MPEKLSYKELEEKVRELEKKLMECTLAKEEAERVSNAKSQFISNISHELRTPLTSILGYAAILESDPTEPLPDSKKESVKLILKSGNHILDLINDIFDLSHIESGKLKISIEEVDICALMKEVFTLIKPMAQERCIILKEPIGNCECSLVMADSTRLKQVIFNLISNAVKYNKIGGLVELYCIEINEGFLRLSVIDTGPGIPEEKQVDLFKPFNRLGAELTVGGTGIGLTITKHLVDLMGGSIGVESSPSTGSCFYVDLLKAENKTTQKEESAF